MGEPNVNYGGAINASLLCRDGRDGEDGGAMVSGVGLVVPGIEPINATLLSYSIGLIIAGL